MTDFPTALSNQTAILSSTLISAVGRTSLELLGDKGFDIQLGISEADAHTVAAIATQPSIVEYCPRDRTERFKDTATTKDWLANGKQVFLLRERATGDVAGYAWTGPGTSPHIPGGSITCALRLSELFQGKGLATPFLGAIINYTVATNPSELLWLEGWESNIGAIHIYKKLGFDLVTQETSSRPTASGETVEDVRLFMQLPEHQGD